jgi:FAD dependent oxidoreductase TIGR03364
VNSIPNERFDLAVVGAGIVGLAHALAAARAGLRVLVLDRDTRAVGASIRNFGFVTVTGQRRGDTWRRARRSRDVWAEIAPQAGIAVYHSGLVMAARRPEALTVLEEFAAGPMGEDCEILRGSEMARFAPALRGDLAGALWSPYELRVESRDAIPALRAYLADALSVRFARAAVHGVAEGALATAAGPVRADRIVVCPGTDLATLYPEIMTRRQTTLCKLHMMRIADPGFRLPGAVMSDLGLVRYAGYREEKSLPALQARLDDEQGAALANGIHLIVVQGADGSLVVGDSHHYGPAPDPFQPREIDELILDELRAVLDIPAPDVVERWVGVYPSGPEDIFVEAPAAGVRLVLVTSGTGASTAFALAEEVLADLLGAGGAAA